MENNNSKEKNSNIKEENNNSKVENSNIKEENNNSKEKIVELTKKKKRKFSFFLTFLFQIKRSN